IVTTRPCLTPLPSYSVALPERLLATHAVPLGLNAMPQGLMRSASSVDAAPARSLTRALRSNESGVAMAGAASARLAAHAVSLKLGRPLFLEGEAGVGKTEVAKVLAAAQNRRLVRLQCYEGLDTSSAVYEWNYPRQMIEIRLAEAGGHVVRDDLAHDIFTTRFLLRRPTLEAPAPPDR